MISLLSQAKLVRFVEDDGATGKDIFTHSLTYSLLLSHFLPELKLFIPHTRARDACRKENTQSAVELDMYQRNEDTMLKIARRISAPKTLAY